MRTSTKPGLATITIVAIVAGLLLAGGAVAYVVTSGSDSSDTTDETEVTEQTTDSSSTTDDVGLLRQALAGGDKIRCEYSDENGQGIAYITDEQQIRVDYTLPESGDSSFIKNDQNIYIWTEGESDGVMFNTDAFDKQYQEQYDVFDPAEFETETPDNVDIDCERDNFDDDLLVAPSNIEFTDIGQLQQSQSVPQSP